MAKSQPHILIFTDLDGTLLDHHSYSAHPADALIGDLQAAGFADVIPITSKTGAELEKLDQQLDLDYKYGVTENGSVIRSDGNVTVLGIPYAVILEHIAALPPTLRKHLRGFADMNAEQVAEATGLPIADAELAKAREATEPFLWSGADTELAELKADMQAHDLVVQQGGRFYHLTGRATKVDAMQKIIAAHNANRADGEPVSIALGDGPNDLSMIEVADFGVIMPNPSGVTVRSNKSNVRTAPAPGPEGWVVAVGEILDELGLNSGQS